MVYHLQENGIIERGYQPITEALARMTKEGKGNWVKTLLAILLAEQTTVYSLTGKTPFFIECGQEAILLIKLWYPI